jgi:hypothetical protein
VRRPSGKGGFNGRRMWNSLNGIIPQFGSGWVAIPDARPP